MKNKLILVEGIPGSGKTTSAKKIAEYLRERGETVNLYLEGDAHPADLGWIARLPIAKLDEIIARYDNFREVIEAQTTIDSEFALVAYTKVSGVPREFYAEMSEFEVYDGRVSDDVFCKLHYERWQTFAQQSAQRNEINIFECAFLQNHINEMLVWRLANESVIIDHLNRLLDTVREMSPVLIMLYPMDIQETITWIAKERVSPYGNWIDHCIQYCEDSPYGKLHNIKGFEGALHVFETRRQIEKAALAHINIPHTVIENQDFDWDDNWARICGFLDSIY